MQQLDFLCLANSRRLGGRCVAGITSSGGWVRPISPDGDGTLYSADYRLSDGSELALLDVIRVQATARPEPHQPENWLISGAQWERLGHLEPLEAKSLLEGRTVPGPEIFGDRSDRILYQRFVGSPAESSLCLIKPTNLSWHRRPSYTGNKQARAAFTLAGAQYDLPVTDSVWEPRLQRLSDGFYQRSAVGIPDQAEVYLTISLAGEFRGECYKLVAAIIVL